MNRAEMNCFKLPYQVPDLRVVILREELSFLQSNLEPIGGGGDPDIDW